jgi:hypothetical protein
MSGSSGRGRQRCRPLTLQILQGLDAAELEQAMRLMAEEQLCDAPEAPAQRALVAMDGKTLRGSLDQFEVCQGRSGAQRAGSP